MLDYLIIIQARLGSTRFPNKVMQTVGGIPMVRRVWLAAKGTGHKTVVAWPERYPDLNEDNVRERFRRIAEEFPSQSIIRLTADCPLLSTEHIRQALMEYEKSSLNYYSTREDGYDVQIFTSEYLFRAIFTHREHVINDPIPTLDTGLSVNTKEDLERVRRIANAR